MPKVLIISQLGILGGEEFHIMQIIDKLKNDLEFDVILSEDGPFHELLKCSGIRTNIIRTIGHFDIIALIKIFFFLKKNRFDIIHIHSPRMAFYVILAGILLKIKNIIWTHHIFIGDAFENNRIKKYFYCKGALFLSKFCRKIIAVSNYIKNKLIGNGFNKKNIVAIYNGIDIKKVNIVNENKMEKLRFGILSRIEGFKGYTLLINTVKKYGLKDHKILVFNTGSMKNKISSLTKEYPNLIYKGFILDKHKIYEDFDILLILSHFEGFCYIAIEGIKYGKVLLMNDLDVLREVVSGYPDIGFLKDFTEQGLYEKIIEISEMKNFVKLKEFVDSYDLSEYAIEKNIEEIRRIYHGVISENMH